MEKKKTVQKSVLHRMMDDKLAIRECIKKGGKVEQVAKERGVILAKPI